MNDRNRDAKTNINRLDGVICLSIAGAWFFLMWLASNHLALYA